MINIYTNIKTVKMFLRQLETFYMQNNSSAYFCFYCAIFGCISMLSILMSCKGKNKKQLRFLHFVRACKRTTVD